MITLFILLFFYIITVRLQHSNFIYWETERMRAERKLKEAQEEFEKELDLYNKKNEL